MHLKETLVEVVIALFPITLVVFILQFTPINLSPENFQHFLGGVGLVFLGLTLFILGVKSGLLEVGESVGARIVQSGRAWILVTGAFMMGFVVTLAEPDVQVLSSNIDRASMGTLQKKWILLSVSSGVALFLSIAVLRLLYQKSLTLFLIIGYALIFLLAPFVPLQYHAVSFDAGGVTTGPLTVPFILSMGVGMSIVRARKRNHAEDSFGMVALASIGPILAILLLGVFGG